MTKFLEWLGFKRPMEVPKGVDAMFLLKYGDALIGTLAAHDGHWTFSYSDEFKQRGEMRTIVEFPYADRTYESKELWQFFASRIPSPEQPEVHRIIQDEHIKEDDAIGLLRRFGRHTVANPFELETVS